MRFVHHAPDPTARYPADGWMATLLDTHVYQMIDDDHPVYERLGLGVTAPPGLPSWSGHFPGWLLTIRKTDDLERRTHRGAAGWEHDVIGRSDLKPTQRLVEFYPTEFPFYWRAKEPDFDRNEMVLHMQGPRGVSSRRVAVGRASIRHGLIEIPGRELGKFGLPDVAAFEYLKAFALSEPPFAR